MQLPSTKCDRVKSRWSKNCTHRHSRTISIKIQATDWTELMLLTHSFAFWTSVSTTPSVHKPLQQYILKCLIIYTFYFIFSNSFIYLFISTIWYFVLWDSYCKSCLSIPSEANMISNEQVFVLSLIYVILIVIYLYI